MRLDKLSMRIPIMKYEGKGPLATLWSGVRRRGREVKREKGERVVNIGMVLHPKTGTHDVTVEYVDTLIDSYFKLQIFIIIFITYYKRTLLHFYQCYSISFYSKIIVMFHSKSSCCK